MIGLINNGLILAGMDVSQQLIVRGGSSSSLSRSLDGRRRGGRRGSHT